MLSRHAGRFRSRRVHRHALQLHQRLAAAPLHRRRDDPPVESARGHDGRYLREYHRGCNTSVVRRSPCAGRRRALLFRRHLERARIVFAIENEMSNEERNLSTNKYWTNVDGERYLQVEDVDEKAFLERNGDDEPAEDESNG